MQLAAVQAIRAWLRRAWLRLDTALAAYNHRLLARYGENGLQRLS